LPVGDADRPLLDAAAQRAGVDAQWVSWRDDTVDWSAFDAALIHSTWDYHEDVDSFLRWSAHVGRLTRLVNPAPVIAWNTHKRYLLHLEQEGLAIVPTIVVERDRPESLAAVVDRTGWTEVVVKPCISAGALGAGRFNADDPAAERALAGLLLEGSDVLVQPYLAEIETAGETSVLVIDGEITHAVVKVPGAGDFRVQLHHGGAERSTEPTEAERDLALEAIDAVSHLAPALYARVDCVTVDGRPRLMELEVIEPALFLTFAGDSVADRLIAALVAHAAARR
jgi:glutathione synthase/RimK-type ligase-like ATP-grasp enzyme